LKKSIIGPISYYFFVSMSIEKGGARGGSKPAPNLGNEELLKKFGLVYKKDEDGNICLLTEDGRVPSDELLSQYAAEAAEQDRQLREIIRQRIRKMEERNNEQKKIKNRK